MFEPSANGNLLSLSHVLSCLVLPCLVVLLLCFLYHCCDVFCWLSFPEHPPLHVQVSSADITDPVPMVSPMVSSSLQILPTRRPDVGGVEDALSEATVDFVRVYSPENESLVQGGVDCGSLLVLCCVVLCCVLCFLVVVLRLSCLLVVLWLSCLVFFFLLCIVSSIQPFP